MFFIMEMIDSIKCTVVVLVTYLTLAACQTCQIDCPDDVESVVCAFDATHRSYKVFTSRCTMNAYNECHKEDYKQTPFRFCVKQHFKVRRSSDSRESSLESCPVFCAEYYQPVCAASQYRDYKYKAFVNGCFLDMVNCRGDEDEGYVEVPLSYCPRHNMMNIFKERVIVTNLHNNEDY